MSEGRRGRVLAAIAAPRVRWLAALVLGGAAALFAANAYSIWAGLVFGLFLAVLWFAAIGEGFLTGWELREFGSAAPLTAVLPLLLLPLAWSLNGTAMYWSRVAPSWWLLSRERGEFEASLTTGVAPDGARGIRRAGTRTAFQTENGLLGVWSAIVHDPTGRMAAARGWGGGTVAPDVREAFRGSQTIWCQRLDGAWFHCHFD